MLERDVEKFTENKFNFENLSSAITKSKFGNFALLKLMLATKPTILSKMASFKMGKEDF